MRLKDETMYRSKDRTDIEQSNDIEYIRNDGYVN